MVEEVIEQAKDVLNDDFQPCFVMQDYKEANVVLTNEQGRWSVSGLWTEPHLFIFLQRRQEQ
jgi:hypothetical protein